MNEDFLDILEALLAAGATFLVVGAHAMTVYGVPRTTGDLDIWVEPNQENAERVWQALLTFGAPVAALGLSKTDFAKPDIVVQLGLPPRRIDIMTKISGLDFGRAWRTKITHPAEHLTVPFIGRDAFVINKKATGRLKDLADVETLQASDRTDEL